MKVLDKIIENIFNYDITLLAGRALSGRTTLTSEVLYKYVIKQDKKALLFSLDGDDTFYVVNLLASMTGIPKKEIASYYHPCCKMDKKKGSVDRNLLIDSIEQIQQSDLTINSNLFIVSDEIDYLCEYVEFERIDLLIINSLDNLVKKSRYSIDEIFTKLKKLAKEYKICILLWNNVANLKNSHILLKDINHYNISKNYVENIILLQRDYEYEKHDIIEIRNYCGANSYKKVVLNYDMKTDTVKES